MTPSLLLLSFILLTFSTYALIKTCVNRHKLSVMSGMMIAMTNGMITGLVSGVALGILFPGDLVQKTIIAMAIGMIIGFLSGVPISILAVLDGTLSGFMAGMMGAMLGAMAAPEFSEQLLKIMFIFSIAIYLMLVYLMNHLLQHSDRSLISQPITLIFIFGLLFIGLQYLGPLTR
jgi:ABC-type methionine transport system permease subunit